jgi:threonyl-tRNA synthetase
MNITDKQSDYAQEVAQKLQKAGFKVKADLRNEKIGFKIREHTLKRVPYMLVCGDQEMEAGEIAVRTRKGKDLGKFKVEDFLTYLQTDVASRKLNLEE